MAQRGSVAAALTLGCGGVHVIAEKVDMVGSVHEEDVKVGIRGISLKKFFRAKRETREKAGRKGEVREEGS